MSNQELVSWAFAAAALVYLAGIATYLMVRKRGDNLAPPASFIVGFLCAVAGGFCAYFFMGALGLTFEIPGTGIKGTAAGGFGAFVLVLLLWRLEGRAAAKERGQIAALQAAKEKEAARQADAEKKADEQAAAETRKAAEQAAARDYEDKMKREAEQKKAANQARDVLLGRPPSGRS